MQPYWPKASACGFHLSVSCAIFSQMVPFQYSSSSSLQRLAGIPLGVFLSYVFQVVIGSVHPLSRILLMCPAQLHIRFLTCLCRVGDLGLFSCPHVMFNILLSIFVCAAGSLFFAYLESAHVNAPYVIAGSTHVDLSLQACSNLTLEYFAVLGECCPSGRNSSLNLLVLDCVAGSVSLSK